MRVVGARVLLLGCVLSAGIGVLLGAMSEGFTAPSSPELESTRAPSSSSHRVLRGSGEAPGPSAVDADTAAAAEVEEAWTRRELQAASSRLSLMRQLSQVASRAEPALTGPMRSADAHDFLAAQAVMGLLAHASVRDVVREHEVDRGSLERLVTGLAVSGIGADPADPDLAAALLPVLVRASRNPEDAEAWEALRAAVQARVSDPGRARALQLHLTERLRPPRTTTAATAEALAAELAEEATSVDLEARLAEVERGLERLEVLQDDTRTTVAKLLETMGPERTYETSIAGLSDLVRGLLASGVEPDRILAADLGPAFPAYDDLERTRQQARLDYDRLWLGRHLEPLAAIPASSDVGMRAADLVRELASVLRLTPEQLEALSQYFAVPARS